MSTGTEKNITENSSYIEETVRKNLPLVHSLIKRYVNRGAEYEDLFQIGSLGLYKACLRFNEELGYQFSTYAAALITGEIRRFLRDDGIIKVSRQLKGVSQKTAQIIKDFQNKHGRTPTISEISDLSGESPETITQALEVAKPVKSVYEEVSEGKTIADILQSSDENEKINDRILIKSVIKKFPDREQKIMIYRYYYDKTQKEVAAMLGLSQVQVSRIEKGLIEKLRKEFNK